MHIIAGAILALVGAGAVAYIARGASAFARELPFLAVGVMLVTIGIGMCGRSRAAGLVARIGIAATLLMTGWIIVTGWFTSGPASTDEGLVRYFQLLGFAIAAAVLAAVFLLVRRAPRRSRFGPIDIVPIAGLAAALTLGMIWLLGDDTHLRPCRLGNDLACQQIATRLLESAERAPSSPPTAWEERAARGPDGAARRYSPLRRGSSRSRKASPTRLNASTATMIASPENVVIHGQHLMYCRPSLRMLPQLGVGGGMPSPRNDRPASVRM